MLVFLLVSLEINSGSLELDVGLAEALCLAAVEVIPPLVEELVEAEVVAEEPNTNPTLIVML